MYQTVANNPPGLVGNWLFSEGSGTTVLDQTANHNNGVFLQAGITQGEPGVLHGALSYLLQDRDGQVVQTHSISAGLDYPGVGPEHAYLSDAGLATYVSASDAQALEGFQALARTEGILPALEPAHVIGWLMTRPLPAGSTVLVCLSGRGDKDLDTIRAALGTNADG